MKNYFTVLIAICLIVTLNINAESELEESLSNASSRYDDAQFEIESDYRKEVAKLLTMSDQIVIYLLDFEMEDTPEGMHFETRDENTFQIFPYGGKSKILKKSAIKDDQHEMLLPKLQDVVIAKNMTKRNEISHFPMHGIIMYSGQKIIFQSSFCWHTRTFRMVYPDSISLVRIRGNKLQEVFNKIMPIPQSEIDRYEKKFGK